MMAPPGGIVRERAGVVRGLQVREALALGWGLAAQPALEQFARDRPAAEPEGQRQREDETAERDAERDQHHLLADAEMSQRGGAGEEDHAPGRRPGEQRAPRPARVDGGDEDRSEEHTSEVQSRFGLS